MKAKHRNESPNTARSVQVKGWMSRTVGTAGVSSTPSGFCYETTTLTLPGLLAVLGGLRARD